jgi:cell division protease FtsH
MALKLTGIDPIHKATIIPRGRALGMVMTLPESRSATRSARRRRRSRAPRHAVRRARGGASSSSVPAKVTSGASGDIQMATNLARSMVMEWGMSEKLGRVRYKSNDQEVFLGHSVTQSQHMSDETAKIIDEEVRMLIEAGERTAREMLTEHHEQFEAIAQALLEFETLTGDELRALMDGKMPVRPDDNEPTSHKASVVPSAGKSTRKRRGPEPEGGLEPQPGS